MSMGGATLASLGTVVLGSIPCLLTGAVNARQKYLLVYFPTILSFVILYGLHEGLIEGIYVNPCLFSYVQGPIVKPAVAYSTHLKEAVSWDQIIAWRPRSD